MAFDVVISNRAASKINATVNYIEEVCSNRHYAKQLYAAIEKSILDLEVKECFHIRDRAASDLLGQTVYRISLGKYRLLYMVSTTANVVLVFSFFHEAQNLPAIIQSDYANRD